MLLSTFLIFIIDKNNNIMINKIIKETLKNFILKETNETKYKDAYERFRYDSSFRYKVIGILSEKGYLFHGTNMEFDKYDNSKIKRTMEGFGAYFTTDEYKCSEYGDQYIILNGNNLNIVDVDKSWEDLNIITPYEILAYKETAKAAIDNAVNIRDYDNAQKEYDFYNEKYKAIYNNIDYDNYKLIKGCEYKLFQPHNTIRNCLSFAYNKLNGDGMKVISNLFNNLGIDGYYIDNIYVIVNFDKLNQNIVKDKNKLINSIL